MAASEREVRASTSLVAAGQLLALEETRAPRWRASSVVLRYEANGGETEPESLKMGMVMDRGRTRSLACTCC